jgi:hypothetical protein
VFSHGRGKAHFNFAMSFRSYGRLSSRISVAPTGRISMKFGIEDFYENVPRKSKFG